VAYQKLDMMKSILTKKYLSHNSGMKPQLVTEVRLKHMHQPMLCIDLYSDILNEMIKNRLNYTKIS
jgi:hypothetical protein